MIGRTLRLRLGRTWFGTECESRGLSGFESYTSEQTLQVVRERSRVPKRQILRAKLASWQYMPFMDYFFGVFDAVFTKLCALLAQRGFHVFVPFYATDSWSTPPHFSYPRQLLLVRLSPATFTAERWRCEEEGPVNSTCVVGGSAGLDLDFRWSTVDFRFRVVSPIRSMSSLLHICLVSCFLLALFAAGIVRTRRGNRNAKKTSKLALKVQIRIQRPRITKLLPI